jgi:asparagine synthase (glutamine-hydrolysing)
MTGAAGEVPGVFVALTFERGTGDDERLALVDRAERAAASVAAVGGGRALVTTSEDPGDDAGLLTLACTTAAAGPLDVAALRARPEAALGVASTLVAPAGLWVRSGGRVVVATDPLAILQLHVVRDDGWAACSTSALALASLSRAGLDEAALSVFALLGVHAGDETPFAGVRTLAPGQACTLADGHAERTPLPATAADRGDGDPVDAGVEAVRASVAAAVAGHDAVHLELSGGLDSRLLLAALRELPVRVTTMTVGSPASPDVRVAGDLSRRLQLPNELVDLAGLAALSPAEAWEVVRRAAVGRDACGNAVGEGVLELVEDRSAQGPRISGQNGEFARGFYYAGQPPWPRPTPALVGALVRWRLTTNDAVDGSLVEPEFREAGSARLAPLVEETLRGYDRPWLAATDELYLDLRMRRWVGPEHSAASRRHPVLAPFFHPAYLAWARRAAPADKRSSRLCAAVLQRMAPDLAALPLDSGRTPAEMARRDAAGRARAVAYSAGKVAAKVRQRLQSTGRPAVGAVALAARVHEHWRAEPAALESVLALPFVARDAVEAFLGGQRGLDVASTSFLVDLAVAAGRR